MHLHLPLFALALVSSPSFLYGQQAQTAETTTTPAPAVQPSHSGQSANSARPPHKGANLVELSEGTVNAVYVTRKNGEVSGGTSPVVIDVMDNRSGHASVGVNEQFYNGIGEQCRSSAWIAAMTASQSLDKIITDYKFNVQVRGLVDGPSMGMLLTATMMALINGDEILPEVTMTGAVNPDGTAGPVGGIPHKMEGAKASGFKVFGYPVGCRMDYNQHPSRPEQVDVEDWGRNLGLKVVVVRNLRDAYQLLTGKKIERTEPASEDELTLSPALSRRIRSMCSSLQSDLNSRSTEIDKKFKLINEAALTKALREDPSAKGMLLGLAKDISDGEKLVNEAEQALSGDAVAQAYILFQRADQLYNAAEVQENLFIPLVQKGVSLELLNEWASVYDDSRNASQQKLQGLKLGLPDYRERTSVGGRVEALHSYLQYGEALVAWLSGESTHRRILIVFEMLKRDKALLESAVIKRKLASTDSLKKSMAEDSGKKNQSAELEASIKSHHDNLVVYLLNLLADASVQWARAARSAQAVKEFGSSGTESGPEAKDNEELLRKLGEAYASASGATLAYFDSLVIKEQAEEQELSMSDMTAAFEVKQPVYGLIKAATRYAQSEPDQAGGLTVPSNSLDRFSASFYAYTQASSFLMKYYTFAAKENDNEAKSEGKGDVSFTHRKALAATLDGARERVLEEVAKVKAELGFIPDAVKLHFDMATTLKYSNNDADLLHALKSYWRCNLLCYLTRQMAK